MPDVTINIEQWDVPLDDLALLDLKILLSGLHSRRLATIKVAANSGDMYEAQAALAEHFSGACAAAGLHKDLETKETNQ